MNVNMLIIYAACVLGAIGLLMMLPRRGSRLGPVGGVLAAAALGMAMLAIANGFAPEVELGADAPGIFFYLFAFLAIAGAVRVITHPRPVYAALYFILVVISSAALLLLLAAEFMAFALVIVYAGAILITYLFVIMLAQETPDDQHEEGLADYDANAREPIAAIAACFILLASILSLTFQSTNGVAPGKMLAPDRELITIDSDLAVLLEKVRMALVQSHQIGPDAIVTRVDPVTRTAEVLPDPDDLASIFLIDLPTDLWTENVERVGLSLLSEFPGGIEVAGVILLMAMLGAAVLSRKPLLVAHGSADTLRLNRSQSAPQEASSR